MKTYTGDRVIDIRGRELELAERVKVGPWRGGLLAPCRETPSSGSTALP